jgi:hypothetical protein
VTLTTVTVRNGKAESTEVALTIVPRCSCTGIHPLVSELPEKADTGTFEYDHMARLSFFRKQENGDTYKIYLHK